MKINTKKLTAAAAGVLLALTASVAAVQAAGLDDLQKKVNESAAKAGVKAPDVRAELAGKAKAETDEVKAGDLPRIKRIVAMPANVIRAIEGRDGKVMYMIDNGRFALIGNMVDVWNRKSLMMLDAVDDAINHIDLQRMGFDLKKTNHITVGTGARRVTLFVDPRCGWCHRLMKEMQDDQAIFKDYTFDIVIVGLLGDESKALAERLACTTETDQMKKFNALVEGRAGVMALPENKGCNKQVLKDTELQRHAMDIQSVPLVITPDKRFARGKPENLRAFLDVNEAKLAKERAEKAQQAALKKAEKDLAKDPDAKPERKRIPLRDTQPAAK